MIFQTLLFFFHFLFFFFFFSFFFAISLVWLLRRICNGTIMAAWTYLFLFYVTIDAYWLILMRFGF